MLAYLVVSKMKAAVELRTAEIDLSAGVAPRIRPVAKYRLASEGTLTAPAFSPDGRWVYAPVRDEAGGATHPGRFATVPDVPLALRPDAASASPNDRR